MWETFHRVRNFEITLSHEEKSLWSHVGKTCEPVSVHVCVYALTCNTHLVQHVVWITGQCGQIQSHWVISQLKCCVCVRVVHAWKMLICQKTWAVSQPLTCGYNIQYVCARVCADVSYRVVIDHFLEAFATLFKAFLWCRVHSVSMDFHMNVKIFLT